jgi:hypothetical protein
MPPASLGCTSPPFAMLTPHPLLCLLLSYNKGLLLSYNEGKHQLLSHMHHGCLYCTLPTVILHRSPPTHTHAQMCLHPDCETLLLLMADHV